MIVSSLTAGVLLGTIFLTWLLAVLTREYSWVDRIWSVVPAVYAWIFAHESGYDARTVLLACLVTLWGARLTFNYARKGGYARGGEDYRWGILRGRMKPWQFQLFNLGFIAGYQNLLLLLITLPIHVVATAAREGRVAPLGVVDLVLAALFVAFLAGETLADQQQWRFHQAKRRALDEGRDPASRFLTEGLFRFSRHPNFFCEQAQWWVVYAFVFVATGAALHPSIVGAILLTLLFHGSTNFTEEITRSRYPEYAEYQRRTSRLLPMPPRTVTAAPDSAT